MNIINNRYNLSNHNNNQTSFKRLSPTSINKIKSLATNEVNRQAYTKLATVAGLSGIISWVNSLKNQKEDTLQKLDIIDSEWSKKANSSLLDPQTQGNFLNLTSDINTFESLLETKYSDKKDTSSSFNINQIPEEAVDLFLSQDKNEQFLSISTEKNIKSIQQQSEAITSASEEQKENALNSLDIKIGGLIKLAENLKKDDFTSNIYEKLSNILRMFIITSLIDDKKDEETNEKIAEIQSTTTNKTEENTEEINIESKDTITEEKKEEVLITTKEKGQEEEIDYSASKEAQKIIPGVNIIEDPQLKATLAKNLGKTAIRETKSNPKEFIYTEQNKDFIDKIFKPYFEKNNSKITPEVYAENIDLIMDIYNFTSRKENVDFLSYLINNNINREITLYKEFCEGDVTNFEFLNFYKLQNFKYTRSNGNDITKEEFDILCNYKNDKLLAYIESPITQKGKNVKVQFTRNASAEERLKILSDVYKIAFAKCEKDLMTPETPEIITKKEIVHEVSVNIARALEKNKSDDYENLLNYLKINKEDMIKHLKDYGIIQENGAVSNDSTKEVEKEEFKFLIETIEKYLNTKSDATRLNSLEKLLNYKKFKGFMSSPHARMRLLSRKIFNSPENFDLQVTTLSKKLKETIASTKTIIESQPYILLQDYVTNPSESVKNPQCGARIVINNVTMGINNNGEIHTIYYED